MTTLTVLIPAWNDAGELAGALTSLARAAERLDGLEVVIAAGGTGRQYEEAKQLAAAFTAGPCTAIPQEPLGKMRALRDAMEVVSTRPSRFLLMLDADTRLDANGLADAMSFLEARPHLAGAGGVIRNIARGIGAAHDLVSLASYARLDRVLAVTGWAILVRGDAVWPHWQQIFAEHDYPLHIDYQICERIVALTGRSFAICPTFVLDTPRARGLAFLREERRHHRAMFARRSIGAQRRYVAGAAVTALLPLVVPAACVPLFWPLALPFAWLSARRVRNLKSRYDVARRTEPRLAEVSFPAFVRDEWVFSLSVLLGAADHLRGHLDGPSFQGYRARK